VIERFLDKGDDILLGGCIANTFIAARGDDVGSSKYEPEEVGTAKRLMDESGKPGKARIHVPTDTVTRDTSILDIGAQTVDTFSGVIAKAKTIVWNGPMGLYEDEAYAGASKKIADAVAKATNGSTGSPGATTVIGGGDTIDFHVRYGYPLDAYTFVSTGGGAMLEFISGKTLPAIEALRA
jgi:phosphoglycerate kinase